MILIVPSVEARGIEFADFSTSLSKRYPLAILMAGGTPHIMPVIPESDFVRESVRRADGVILTGGDDLDPARFRKRTPARLRETVKLDHPQRDAVEFTVIEEVFRQRKPLLAICRGLQMLNVALGGDLIVDIPQEVDGAMAHRQMDRKNEAVHEVALTPGSLLHRSHGTQALGVNSTHHQAAGRVAPKLRVSARSADGVIEGLELAVAEARRGPWLVAVQYHPERLFDRHPAHAALFRAFVRASTGTK
ncbi:MAG: gamma-glutamyl-gamma-aminobutyrate hydrolase family protein [Rhodobacteraceae bacterium]|nr:gamma-glutamyl-gamma-aminobutyrate hydrolase family protein [Paracoccaceae bacterium]